ncbi:MAG: thiamine-phosphate kinase [Candidatus Thermoplasmatota archaeon]|nr:thiamine-phosphate kinase [Candidatus Thermoplasmatota archaeon]
MELKLKDLGERKIIDRIFSLSGMKQEKDDCAVIKFKGQNILISTDSVSLPTHFFPEVEPETMGSFLAAINLSDIAAMAGEPHSFLLSLQVPADYQYSFLDEFVSGITRMLRSFHTRLDGGDTKEGVNFEATGFVMGYQKPKSTLYRSRIGKNQVLCTTNKMGKAASGYVFYRSSYRKDLGLKLMYDVKPRIREASLIAEYGGKFMMDLSDGLYSSIGQMKRDYGIGFRIVEDELPPDSHVKKAVDLSGATPAEVMCRFGGDYELLFTIDNSNYGDFKDAMESNKISVSYIGDTWDGENMMFDGNRWRLIDDPGYEHFAPKPKLGRIE